MQSKSFVTSVCAVVLLVGLQLSTYAVAAAPGAVELKSIAEREVEVTENGKKILKRIAVDKIAPGDEVIYTTSFKNLIKKPVGDIAINNPVPNDTSYVSGSAFGDNVDINFSVDGGKTFAAPDKLTVTGADGSKRPALAADYTHIRWVYRGELGVGKSGQVGFRATVN